MSIRRPTLAFALAAAAGCMFLAAGATPARAADFSRYSALLQRHTVAVDDVVGTRVDYGAIARDPEWPKLLKQLRRVDLGALANRKERLALWINAYNIVAIDVVVQNHPVNSIKDIGSIFNPVWDQKVGNVGGRKIALDEIEHEILRPMGDPRIHAAIICASVSCPPLRREAYVAERLDEQLDGSIRAWLANPEKGIAIDRGAKRVRISKIFDWFEDDFEALGGVLEFIARHLPDDDAAWLRAHSQSVRVSYFGYDWSLNGVAS